jgi:hypothetical protein
VVVNKTPDVTCGRMEPVDKALRRVLVATVFVSAGIEAASLDRLMKSPRHSESPALIRFLRTILEEAPAWLDSTDRFGRHYPALHYGDDYFLLYLENRQPARMGLAFPEGNAYTVEVIDAWGITVERLPFLHRGTATIPLPGRSYQALRLRSVAG